MTRKRISADAALLGRLPYIQFRGVDYQLRDMTVRERVERALRLKARQEAIEAAQEAAQAEIEAEEREPTDEEVVESVGALQEVYAQALQEALVDFPDDVAGSVTEMEFQALMAAINEARDLTFSVAVEEVEEKDLKTAGRGTG